jgi:hypothetical protein
MKYKATVTYEVTIGEIEWNDLYLAHQGITGLNDTLPREQVVQRLKDVIALEFDAEIVAAAVSEGQAGEPSGTLYFGYRTENGRMQVIVDAEPWWRAASLPNNELKLLGTPDWWKEHDAEDESNVAIGRVTYEANDTGWDYEGADPK